MSKRSQVFEIIRLVTLLMGGLGTVSAYAQAPTFSAPSLPPIPGAPAAPSAPLAPQPIAPAMNASVAPSPVNSSGGLSDLSAISKSTATASSAAAATTTTGNPAAVPPDQPPALPPPALPESSDKVAAAPAGMLPATTLPDIVADQSAPPPPPPVLTAPSGLQPATVAPKPLANNQPAPLLFPAAEPAKQTANAAPPTVKTWETKLKSTAEDTETNFNYKRVLLPSAIYRTVYDRENDHLPIRTTREEYVRLLFATATHNDINGTRALLNAGTDINAVDAYGETPLMAARRAGAMDVAALLVARGAQ